MGPSFGYSVNASKTWLVIRKEFQSEAKAIFRDTEVKTTSEGCTDLGVPLGSPDDVSKYVSEKIQQWSKEFKLNAKNEFRLVRTFASLIFKGKTHAPLDLLTNSGKGGVLRLDQSVNADEFDSKSVREVLESMYPIGQPASLESIESNVQGPPPEIDPVVFDSIDACLIHSIVLKTSDAAVPAGLNAHA